MINHPVLLDVAKHISRCVVEIPQGDANSHQLLFKIVQSGKPYNITNLSPKIEFTDDTTGQIIESKYVTIINGYRGQASYIVGPSLLRDARRCTVVLKFYHDSQCRLSDSFVVNIIKNTECDCDPYCGREVVISKDFVRHVENHLGDSDIHISPSEREALENLDELNKLTPYIEELEEYGESSGNSKSSDKVNGKLIIKISGNPDIEYDGSKDTPVEITNVNINLINGGNAEDE